MIKHTKSQAFRIVKKHLENENLCEVFDVFTNALTPPKYRLGIISS